MTMHKSFYSLPSLINAIKKKDLVDYIEKLKWKVVTGKQIQNLCSETFKLSENIKVL